MSSNTTLSTFEYGNIFLSVKYIRMLKYRVL